MKKSTLLAVIALVMALAMGITGTMAYLQDTDADVNVMTLGNVYIEQIELERDENGNLQQFAQNKPLYPAVYEDKSAWQPVFPENDPNTIHWAASDVDGLIEGIPTGAWNGMWDAKLISNVQDKFVFVKNTGKSDAYIRTIYAFEADTSNFADPEGFGLIRANWNGNTRFDYGQAEGRQAGSDKDIYIENVEINGVLYNLVVVTYQEPVAPGEVIRPSLLQVGMDKAAGNKEVEQFGETYDILVVSQAVQTMGFTSAQEALEAAFGVIDAENHPWADGAPTTPAVIGTAAELKAALAAGGQINLAKDIDLGEEALAVPAGTEVTLNLNGKTLSAKNTDAAASCAIENKGTLTITGEGTITYEGVGSSNYGYGTNTITNYGKLVIDGAAVINTTDSGSSNAIDNAPGAELIVNDGVIKAEKIAIRMRDASVATMNGGTIEGSRAMQIQLFQKVDADTVVTINGGTFTSNNADEELAFYSTSSSGSTFARTFVTITGGTFNGHVCFGGGDKTAQETVSITGGTFNGDVGRYLAGNGWEDIAH